jgi:hypothetical protein
MKVQKARAEREEVRHVAQVLGDDDASTWCEHAMNLGEEGNPCAGMCLRSSWAESGTTTASMASLSAGRCWKLAASESPVFHDCRARAIDDSVISIGS